MSHKEPIIIDTIIIPITHDHDIVCRLLSASRNALTIRGTSAPLIRSLDATLAEISSSRCKSTDDVGCDCHHCNTVSSENVNIVSTSGNTTWVLLRETVVLPNECGNSLNFSAYT